MTRIAALFGGMLLSCAACACGQSADNAPKPAEHAAPAAKAAPAAPPAPAAPAAPPTDRVDDPTFELAAAPAGPYAPGKLASFAVSLKPRGEYHVNQDFPMTISVQSSGAVEFPKAKLGKAEAAQFTEQIARFDVPFTPKAAGAHKVEAHVRFAVCTPENCIPDERTLAVVLPVE
jgi:hypothetical protein